MDELISRQAAIDIVLEYARRLYKHVGTPEDNESYSFGRGLLLSIERNLKGLPPAEPKRGKWVDDGDPLMLTCGNCGYGVMRYNNTPFCPNCGAKMEATE